MKPEQPCCAVCGQPLPGSTVGPVCPDCAFRGALEVRPEDGSQKAVVGGQLSVVRNQEGEAGGARVFGDYELLEEIARGGMGIVYKARQRGLNRLVAVKVMLTGQFTQPDFLQRFRTEAAAIGALQHPNIVAIHEVGEHEGQPYFSMDFVEGRTLAQIARDGPLAAKRAATYLKAIAAAVHYVHEHGILHRDLKPSNIIIDSLDQPRITDFGLAKRLTSDSGPSTSDLTLMGQVLGSPNYLSPEQAAGQHAEVGPASDVYALGTMLYHLLTGRPPFQSDSLTTLLRQVIETEPVAPRLLNASTPRDLETICLKCLEKDRARRYATARELADELGRFLRSEPILARPASRPEKAWRWCRRKPALATALGAVVLVAAAGFVGILSQWQAAVKARVQSDQERYDAAVAEAQLLIEQNRPDRAREILAREGQEGYRGWEWGWLQRQVNQELITFTLKEPALAVAFSPDQRSLATGGYDQVATLWDTETGRPGPVFKGHSGRIWSIAFSPDGRSLLTTSPDTTARVWDVATGRQLHVLTNADGVFQGVFSPDGQVIATAALNGGGRLWDARSGALLPERPEHDQAVCTIAFSPDGRRLACAGGRWVMNEDTDTTVSILERARGPVLRFNAHRQTIYNASFSPDGRFLATASGDGTAKLWNAQTGSEVRPLKGRFHAEENITYVDFSPDGRWLAVSGASWGASPARVFEVATGDLVRNLPGHAMGVLQIKFSPDGNRLATAGLDATARIWSAASLPEFLSLEGHDQAVWAITFSRDGKRLASGSLDQTARVWDANTGDLLTTLNVGFPVVSLAFNPQGDRLVTTGPDHTACIWPVQTNPESRSSRGEEAQTENSALRTPNSEIDQSLLTSAATNAELVRLRGHSGTVMAVAWSSDGKRILTGSKDGTACLWDARTGTQLRQVPCHTNWVLSVAFDPDGRRFATGSADNTARIWEVQAGRRLRVLQGHGNWVQQVAFSPDGRQLATGSRDRKARLFDADTGRLLFSMEGHRSGISSLGFSPDGSRLVTAGAGEGLSSAGFHERTALIWDVHTGQQLLKLVAHLNWVTAVAFSPEGRHLATGSADNTVRIREAFPWKPKDYAAEAGASSAEKMEAFKRRYWQAQLRSGAGVVSLGKREVRPSRRVQNYYDGAAEVNLPLERGTKMRPAKPLPPRERQADANLMDLTSSYNAGLTETWQPINGPFEIDQNLASLPTGVHTLVGVPFDIRGLIRLSRPAFGWAVFPTRVEIPTARRFQRLHALHGAGARALLGAQIGTYRLHYHDGSSADLPIVYGRDVRDWLAHGGALAQPMEATIAWTGPTDLTQPAEAQFRVYKQTYENPFPEREVARITFESTMTTAGPFLVALTVEP